MPEAQHNAVLNALLVRLYRSLLQYTIECWPWVETNREDERRVVEELAQKQMVQVSRIAELLGARGWAIDFGTYPDWSELHYVSLEYLLAKLVEDQTQLVSNIRAAQLALADDSDGALLAAQVLVGEERHLAKLKELDAAQQQLASA